MRNLIAILFWLGLVLSPNVATAQSAPAVSAAPGVVVPGPRRTERIEAQLVPMSAWAAPGSTAVVAVRQAIEPGWHTYWRNPGDSGGATTLDWVLPAEVRAGDIVWPLPERQRLQSLMNYGYSGTVFLPVPIEIPADARPGTTLPLTVKALFLVCSAEMCVPDELTLSLDLPIREGAAPLDPRYGARIRAVVETAPRPAGIRASAAMIDGRLVLTAVGGPLAEAAPRRAWFFPDEGGVINHAAVQTGEHGPQGLTLTLQPGGDLTVGGLTGPVTGVLATDRGAWEITAVPGPPPAGASGGGALSTGDAGVGSTDGLVAFARAALFALVGGLILNLMPCVFPILAMKGAALAATAHAPGEARRDGLAFLAGVLTTFLVLAGALLALRAGGEAVGWGFQLQSPAVTAGLTLLMLAVALNLSGVFHVGAGLQGVGAGPLARLPGGIGAFFTGVLAVVVAAPCTAPFMGPAIGWALTQPPAAALVVFLGLAIGFALPFVSVAFIPGLLARLPRPGAWMETFKKALAFPMFATVAWLVWVLTVQVGSDAVPRILGAAIVLALALWIAGTAQKRVATGGRPIVLASLAAGLGLIAVGGGAFWPQYTLAAPTEVAGADATHLDYEPYTPERLAALQAEGRPVLVNYTAAWCVSCQVNDRVALSTKAVSEALTRHNAVYLKADWTKRDPAIAAELARFGRAGVPLYLVYGARGGEPVILPSILTTGVVVKALDAAAKPS